MKSQLRVIDGGASDAPRVLPHDEAAERSLVVSAIADDAVCTQALAAVREEHFHDRGHRTVFRALGALQAAGQPTTLVSVLGWIREQGRLGEWESAVALAEAYRPDLYETSLNVSRYATLIRDAWRMRELVRISERAIGMATHGYQAQESLDEVAADVFRLAGDTPTFTAVSARDLAKEVVQDAADAVKRLDAGGSLFVQTGFGEFDRIVAGLADGGMHLVAARPGMGKTSFVLGVAVNVAARGEWVYFATAEMPAKQLMMRCACMLASVSYARVVAGAVTQSELDKFFKAIYRLADMPIVWDSLTAPTVPEIRAKVERASAEVRRKGKALRLVVVDYLGKLRPVGVGSNASSEEKAANVVENCANAAKVTGLPWLVAAQLSRAVVERGKLRRPQQTDLRGSGTIENEAHTITFIHREDYAKEQSHEVFTPTRDAELIVSKNRNGDTGTAVVRFFREYTRFENKEEYE